MTCPEGRDNGPCLVLTSGYLQRAKTTPGCTSMMAAHLNRAWARQYLGHLQSIVAECASSETVPDPSVLSAFRTVARSLMTATIRKDELEAKIKEERELVRSGELREENPLDLSAEFEEFLQACRRGDLRRCQEMISSGVNINGKDQFDYTPLIIVSPER
jgi:hypothetical protein